MNTILNQSNRKKTWNNSWFKTLDWIWLLKRNKKSNINLVYFVCPLQLIPTVSYIIIWFKYWKPLEIPSFVIILIIIFTTIHFVLLYTCVSHHNHFVDQLFFYSKSRSFSIVLLNEEKENQKQHFIVTNVRSALLDLPSSATLNPVYLKVNDV